MTLAGGRIRRRTRRAWLRVFVVGLLLWIECLVVTLATGNSNLLPTLILLGSFLVPVTFVAWAFERWRDEHVTAGVLFREARNGRLSNAFLVLVALLGLFTLRATWRKTRRLEVAEGLSR